MHKHEKINYVEFPAKDIKATKAFFSKVFGWSFVDYGSEYTANYKMREGRGSRGAEGAGEE